MRRSSALRDSLIILIHSLHRELILEERCGKSPGQKIEQYIYQLAESIQLKPVQPTKIHLIDSISKYSNIKQRTFSPTERVIVYFLLKSYIAKLSIYHYKNFHISCMYSLCLLLKDAVTKGVCNIMNSALNG